MIASTRASFKNVLIKKQAVKTKTRTRVRRYAHYTSCYVTTFPYSPNCGVMNNADGTKRFPVLNGFIAFKQPIQLDRNVRACVQNDGVNF